jgi:photosystem II stability/assembly factor-like uncharacterized protein
VLKLMRNPCLLVLSFALVAAGCSEPRVPGVAGGLAAGPWENVTGDLAGKPSECGNLPWLSARPDRDELIAGVARQGLWSRAAGASTWTQLGRGAGSAVITNRTTTLIHDPANAATFWESGIYNSYGVYRSVDDGNSFAQLGLDSGSAGANCCDAISIDLVDPARLTLLAGAHESGRHLFRSVNGGRTWTDIGSSLPADAGNTSYPLVLSAQVFLLGSWPVPGGGIFRSADGGGSWARVSGTPVHSQPLVASDGAIYWMADGNGGLLRSTDQGQTFALVTAGNLLLTTAGIVELPGGRLGVPGVDGHVLVSADRGATWRQINTALPITPTGLLYSTRQKAFYAWYWTCNLTGNPVAADAIQRLAFP